MYFIPFHGLLNCKCVSAKIAELNVGSKQSLEHLWILNIQMLTSFPCNLHFRLDAIGCKTASDCYCHNMLCGSERTRLCGRTEVAASESTSSPPKPASSLLVVAAKALAVAAGAHTAEVRMPRTAPAMAPPYCSTSLVRRDKIRTCLQSSRNHRKDSCGHCTLPRRATRGSLEARSSARCRGERQPSEEEGDGSSLSCNIKRQSVAAHARSNGH